MRFKRPRVRYAETPQPATPYQAAAQAWDERIGSARVQAKNWRVMAFGCLALALLMAGGLVWRSAQSIVTPYVVEVDRSGQVRAVGEAATPYRPPMRRSPITWRASSRWCARFRSIRSLFGRTGSMLTTTPPTVARPCSTTTHAPAIRSSAWARSR